MTGAPSGAPVVDNDGASGVVLARPRPCSAGEASPSPFVRLPALSGRWESRWPVTRDQQGRIMARGWWAWLVVGLCGSAAASGLPYGATHPRVFTGTYAIRLCMGSCPTGPGTESVGRMGALVLLPSPLLDAHGRRGYKYLEREPINGCLLLEPWTGPAGFAQFDPGACRRRFLVRWNSNSSVHRMGVTGCICI